MQQPRSFSPYNPQIGCFLLSATLLLMCLMPLFLIDAARLALQKLHLNPFGATLVLAGILVGGLINLPLFLLERDTQQPLITHRLHALRGWVPIVELRPMRTIIAVNVGGCLIPVALVIFEAVLVWSASVPAGWAMAAVSGVNIAVCYFVARPVPGLGIAMPAFTSPAVSVIATWLLLMPDDYAMIRAPVAFVAGVLGPLIGADLLHLRDIGKMAAPVISIGGAGTFDGIVLSGLLAAFLV